jgi:hypothetical protein
MKSVSITMNPRAHTVQMRANNEPVITLSFAGRSEADVKDALLSLASLAFKKLNEFPVEEVPAFAG